MSFIPHQKPAWNTNTKYPKPRLHARIHFTRKPAHLLTQSTPFLNAFQSQNTTCSRFYPYPVTLNDVNICKAIVLCQYNTRTQPCWQLSLWSAISHHVIICEAFILCHYNTGTPSWWQLNLWSMISNDVIICEAFALCHYNHWTQPF